ncbi:MAG: efflux RND transporter periplasmic adaptor subunit [Candidatus Binataceae bacterium]|jgi:Cu(I)/Ag(I) efflux system membrane fusion protein/cobalt-zinc-cadmium efflux system membrane fusion protein
MTNHVATYKSGRLARATVIATTAVVMMLILTAMGAAFAQAVAPVQISSERRQLIGLQFATVQEKDLVDQIDATASIEADEQREAYVQTRFAGWIEKVYANQTYQHVSRGQPLFTIYSPDLVSTQQEYILALTAGEHLGGSSVEGVAANSAALIDAAAERLKLWGISEGQIRRLARDHKIRRALEIDAPASGYLVERAALPNMYVQPETRLYTIADLTRVWAYIAVFQNDAGKVKLGDPAVLTVDAYPGERFAGKVDFIWPQVDVATRTIRVRCEFDNRAGKLMPGMFARATLQIPMGRRLAIPDSAVLRTGTRDVAFVDRGDGYLTPREVGLGPHLGQDYVVLSGLRAGERIVSSANFLIDSESQLQSALGGFAPPEPAPAAKPSSEPEAAAGAKIEMTTEPNPPYRGRNKVICKLRDASGAPVSGAKVSVTFFMAGMPAMGMPAMRVQSVAAERAGGIYVAEVNLESGGIWKVTIAAHQGDRQIAMRQLEVSAGGGM